MVFCRPVSYTHLKVTDLWSKQYKVISRANGVILKAHRAVEAGASEAKINGFIAEAHFHRACAYAKLSSKFGGIPLVEDDIDIEAGMACLLYTSNLLLNIGPLPDGTILEENGKTLGEVGDYLEKNGFPALNTKDYMDYRTKACLLYTSGLE